MLRKIFARCFVTIQPYLKYGQNLGISSVKTGIDVLDLSLFNGSIKSYIKKGISWTW
jgi:hypothetical protein